MNAAMQIKVDFIEQICISLPEDSKTECLFYFVVQSDIQWSYVRLQKHRAVEK